MNLKLVPNGNAKENFNSTTNMWDFSCQDGADECWGNLLHSCMLYFYPKMADHMPFVHCMESDAADVRDAAVKCSKKLNIPLDNVTKCMQTRFGNNLQHINAKLTEALRPAHKYVPWVTLNGVHTEDIQTQAQQDLVKLICGTPSM